MWMDAQGQGCWSSNVKFKVFALIMNINGVIDVLRERVTILLTRSQSVFLVKGSLVQSHSENRGKGSFPVLEILTGPLSW